MSLVWIRTRPRGRSSSLLLVPAFLVFVVLVDYCVSSLAVIGSDLLAIVFVTLLLQRKQETMEGE